ncbi:MAG: FtsQ-type POTRA domain-containing protein [Oscillospiraceae bacterium]|jgi:hypothetical protein|nr:FtsQ-type POTRA domain-containing protein [Oscillospiraceae bacterium]
MADKRQRGSSPGGKPRGSRPLAPPGKKAPPAAKAASPKKRPPPPKKGGQSAGRPAGKRPARAARQQRIAETQAARRHRYKKNYTLYYIMLAALLTITGVTLSLTVFFNIQTITVTGSSLYTEQQVLDILDAQVGDNLLRLNTKRVQQNARQRLTSAESVTLKRRFPNTLEVQIEDAVVASQVVSGGKAYQVSSGGRIVDILPESVAGVLTVFGPDLSRMTAGEELADLVGKFAPPEGADAETQKAAAAVQEEQRQLLDSVVILQREIAACGQADISVLDVRESLSLRLYYQNRFEVALGTLSELPEKLAMFQSVLKEGGLGLEEKGVLNISDPDCCIVSHSEPLLPEGVTLAGWDWTDLHLENFDVFFGFAEPEPESEPSADSSTDEPDEGDSSGDSGSSSDSSSGSDVSEPASGESSEAQSDGASDSEPSSEPASSGGFKLPLLPQVGGSSSASHEPSEELVSSVPAGDPSSGPPPDSSGSGAASDGSLAPSQPGYILPQRPKPAE